MTPEDKSKERRKHKYRRPGHRYLVEYEELLTKPERITKEELKKLMDEGKNPLILDVRSGHDYMESDVRIKGAVRIRPAEVHDIIDKLPKDRPIIVY